MCQNFWPMLSGALCAGVAALLTAVKTGDVWIWPAALLIIAIGTLRAFQMRNYQTSGNTASGASAKRWEAQYRAGAVLYALSLGLWSAIVILGTDDPVAHMLCTTVTVGYTAGGAARNYGRPNIVQLHLLGACGPMSLALVLHGGTYYYGLAALLVLFFFGLRLINLNLHAIFVNALLAGEREAALANQFDTALNNMPHGLCMFGGKDGRLAVMNHRFAQMMRLPTDFMHRSGSAAEIVKACVAGRHHLRGQRTADRVRDRQRSGWRDHHGRFRNHRRACVLLDVPADDRRRHRGAGRGHHRTPQRRGAHHRSRPATTN